MKIAAFKNVENKTFEPIPAGIYTLELKEASWVVARSGSNMVKWVFLVADGEFKGRMLFHNTVANENPFGLMNILVSFGHTEDEIKSDDFDVIPEKYVGMLLTAKVKCEPREDNGEMSNSVHYTKKIEGTLPPSQKKSSLKLS